MALQLIYNSPVTAELTGEDAEFYFTAKLTLPLGSEHTIGCAYNASRSANIVATSGLHVPEAYRDRGIATRLLKAGLALAKLNDANISMSHITSPYALMARRSIFGDENLTICDDDRDATPLGIAIEDAIEALVSGDREYGFVVVSNLVEVDTTGWEPQLLS